MRCDFGWCPPDNFQEQKAAAAAEAADAVASAEAAGNAEAAPEVAGDSQDGQSLTGPWEWLQLGCGRV